MESNVSPLIEQRADPFVYKHTDGYYYFTASLPAFDAIELRRAQTISALANAPTVLVWRKHDSGPMSMNIWAPEIHFIDGKWYIYFAAAQQDADESGCYDHRMYVLENDSANPLDGTFIEKGQINSGWESFALDATSFLLDGTRYYVWAQRDYAIAGNSNLYIAKMENPWTLQLPAVMISKPEFDWECEGFLVNEGAAVLLRDDKVFITYSGSATDERYSMGLLWAMQNANLLDLSSWTKSQTPVMVTDEARGLFGPGHNSFTVDEEGRDLLVFHARPYPGFQGTALSDPNRHTYVQLLHYDEDGWPVFQE
ncbi:MAG: family 43 glycosylhydrolase [Clostridiales bacterium]|nr:family 43 glycosylhydrolase [Clostridiales bacterium]